MAIDPCSAVKTNQWLGSGAHQNGWGVWLYKRPLRHRILRFLLLQRWRLLFADLRDSKPFSLLTSLHTGSRPLDLPADSPLSSCSSPAAAAVSRPPAAIRRMLERAVREQLFSLKLLSHRSLPSQPLRVPGTRGQLCQECTVSQPTDIIPGIIFRLGPNECCLLSRKRQRAAVWPEDTGLMASTSPVLQLGLLRMRPLQHWLKPRVPSDAWGHGRLRIKVNWELGVTALGTWKCYQWMKQGMPLEMVCRRKVVLTDASNTGWGAL